MQVKYRFTSCIKLQKLRHSVQNCHGNQPLLHSQTIQVFSWTQIVWWAHGKLQKMTYLRRLTNFVSYLNLLDEGSVACTSSSFFSPTIFFERIIQVGSKLKWKFLPSPFLKQKPLLKRNRFNFVKLLASWVSSN